MNIIKQSTGTISKISDSKVITLDLAYAKALRSEWREYAKPQSIDGNHKYVVAFFGIDKDLAEITQSDLAKFKEWLIAQPKLKALSSQNKKLLHLSALMKLARESWGYPNVPKLVFNIKSPKQSRKFIYSLDQENTLILHFKGARNDFMSDLICYLADTGVRLSEALNLRLQDIRMDSKVIDVWESKGDEPRGIPMTDRVYQILTRRKSFGELKVHQVETAFRKARTLVGLPEDATMHSFRHTFATRMLEAGVDIQVVQQLLGHKSITTTTIYAKMTSKRKVDAMQLFQAKKVA
jgi:integrase